jgi:hypothetical protein
VVERVQHRPRGLHVGHRKTGGRRLTAPPALTICRRAMTIDFTCQKCEGSFEIDAADLIDGTEKLVCPHCDVKAPANLVDDFNAALTEMLAQVAAMSKKFAVNMAVESEEVEDELEEDAEEDEDDAEEGDEDEDDLDFDEDDADEDEDDLEDEDAER